MTNDELPNHLVIIITRLTAEKNGSNDEYVQDWKSSGNEEFIAINIQKSTAFIIHGHNNLLGCESPKSLKDVITENLNKANIIDAKYNHIWLFVHGTIPETGKRIECGTNPEIIEKKPNGKILKCYSYSSEGEPSASLALRKTLQKASGEGMPQDLVNHICEKLHLHPAVGNITRDMQNLLLELQIILGMLKKDSSIYESKSDRILKIDRMLKDENHLNAPPMKKVLFTLFRYKSNHSWTMSNLTESLYPSVHERFNSDKNTMLYRNSMDIKCFNLSDSEGRLCSYDTLKNIKDGAISIMSARLELAVECAAQMDKGEKF